MKNITIVISIFVLALMVSACGNNKQSTSQHKTNTVSFNNTYEFKEKTKDHNRGTVKSETVKVPINPHRVAVMDYGALDTMKSLNLENRIVAISKGQNASFLPERLKSFEAKKYVNLGNPGTPNYEKLAKAKPEVIFASFRQAHSKTLAEMKKAAPQAKIIFVSPHYDKYIQSVKDNAMIIGKIFEREKDVQHMSDKLDHQLSKTKHVINKDKVLLLNVDDKDMKAYGSTGRFGGFLHKTLGIRHADTNMKSSSSGAVISYEYLAQKNPDKLFIIDRTSKGNTHGVPEALKNPVIKNVKAIKNDDIALFEANDWFFNEGGLQATMEQLNDVEKAFNE